MNPGASSAPTRNWSRFLHRLWLVGGRVWLAAVAPINFGAWMSTIPERSTYEVRDLCNAYLRARMENRPTPEPNGALQREFDFVGADSQACPEARRTISASEELFWRAIRNTSLFGIVPLVVILLIGHGIAWAVRGLRDTT